MLSFTQKQNQLQYVYTDGHTSTNAHVKVEVISNVYPFYGEAVCEAKPTLNIAILNRGKHWTVIK